jgi:hypothetical protein
MVMKLIDDEKLKPVITTKYVVKNGSPIVVVYYDEDGDWQFFGKERFNEKDAFVISIQQILDIDNSLVNLPDLERGQQALRSDKNADWKIS